MPDYEGAIFHSYKEINFNQLGAGKDSGGDNNRWSLVGIPAEEI